MTKESTKIEFRCRRVQGMHTASDWVEMLFPGNRNQQYAAACILFELKWADAILPSLGPLEDRYGISRRTLQRARAKLARLGLIEHVSSLNARYGGQAGWKLSGRFAGALRMLADRVEQWAGASEPNARERDRILLQFSRPPRRSDTRPVGGTPAPDG